MPGKRKKSKSNGNKDHVLLLVKAGRSYYAAALAWKLPNDYVGALNDYEPKKGDPVIASTRAFVIQLTDELQALEKKLGGVLTPPGPPK